MFHKCLCCGKPLTNLQSMQIGYGDVCRMNLKIKRVGKVDMFEVNKPDFAVMYSDNQYLIIEDLDLGNKSVTNGVEEVISELSKSYNLKELNLIYKDSDNTFDVIVLNESGKFSNFAPLGVQDLDQAIQLHKQKYSLNKEH